MDYLGGVWQAFPVKLCSVCWSFAHANPILFLRTATGDASMSNAFSPLTYKEAGVDIDAGDQLVENIKPFAKRTMRPEVLGGIGGFGALVEVSKKFKNPVMVSGTDGVGTKLKLAFHLNKHDTVGQDLVAMSVNDILVQGAEPIFFLDYFACGKLNVAVATDVVKGIAYGCELAGCALIGGETAEMPSMYPEGEYDLAGFAVGLIEKDDVITGKNIRAGDVVLGLQSSGAHSNGYSLIRKIIERSGVDLHASANRQLALDLLAPTRIYVKPLLALMAAHPGMVKGMAHITGGGLTENIPRVLPDDVTAAIDSKSWQALSVFTWLQQHGEVDAQEMARTFNCGIGMVAIVATEQAELAAKFLRDAGEVVFNIGAIRARGEGERQTIVA